MSFPAAIHVLNYLLLLLSSVITVSGIDAVKITGVNVPQIVRNGSDPIVLDCDYNVQLTDDPVTAGLVVKWYYNDNTVPMYQWIAGEAPQATGNFLGRLNLTYKSSDDPDKVYKAVQILSPTTDMTGEYKCLVTTFESEAKSEVKKMTVYVPEREMRLYAPETDAQDGKFKIICSAYDIFPEPNMTLSARESINENDRQQIEVISKDGLFDITATMQMEDKGNWGSVTFDCVLRIPDANYTVHKSIIYYPSEKKCEDVEPPLSENSGNVAWVAGSVSVLSIVFLELFKLLLHHA